MTFWIRCAKCGEILSQVDQKSTGANGVYENIIRPVSNSKCPHEPTASLREIKAIAERDGKKPHEVINEASAKWQARERIDKLPKGVEIVL